MKNFWKIFQKNNLKKGGDKDSLLYRYDFFLIFISVIVISALVTIMSLHPAESRATAAVVLRVATGYLGAPVLLLSLLIVPFLIWICCSKYGAIRLGSGKPEFSTVSWIVMMLVCSQGAGALYWVFTEWGYHFLAAPQLNGVETNEAMKYELAIAFTFFHWGPAGWALMCAFILPFSYHYYIKKNTDMRLSQLCSYAIGKKLADGILGKIIDLVFIFMVMGNICMTISLGTAILGSTLSLILGITPSFTFGLFLLIGITAFFALFSLKGNQSGLQKITGLNSYFCIALMGFVFLAGPTQFIIDSTVNSLGIMIDNYVRLNTRTDPVTATGHPQTWTVFYMALWLAYGPFMGVFVTRISRGRALRELIPAMILSGSVGMFVFLGIAGGYEAHLRIEGVLDVPAMIAAGQSMQVPTSALEKLPLSPLLLVAFAVIIILFMASSLEASSLALATATSRKLRLGENPNLAFKLFWRFLLIGLPLTMGYIGTDVDTIKSISAVVGLSLAVVFCIIYAGLFKAVRKEPDILFQNEEKTPLPLEEA